MSYCLWLNGKKVYNADDIKENFDLISLRGYYNGGSLLKWLADSGDTKYLRRFDNAKKKLNDINEILRFVFDVRDTKLIINNSNKPVKQRTVLTFSSFSSFNSFSSFSSFSSFGSFGSYSSFGSFSSFVSHSSLNLYGFGIDII